MFEAFKGPVWHEMTEQELQGYYDAQTNHVCVIQETPDGMGCVTCIYG